VPVTRGPARVGDGWMPARGRRRGEAMRVRPVGLGVGPWRRLGNCDTPSGGRRSWLCFRVRFGWRGTSNTMGVNLGVLSWFPKLPWRRGTYHGSMVFSFLSPSLVLARFQHVCQCDRNNRHPTSCVADFEVLWLLLIQIDSHFQFKLNAVIVFKE
jgi:hypothetical protein